MKLKSNKALLAALNEIKSKWNISVNAINQFVKGWRDLPPPVIVYGPPGVAKTSRLLQLAEDKKATAEVVIASHTDPTELNGHLVIDQAGAVTSGFLNNLFLEQKSAKEIAAAILNEVNRCSHLEELVNDCMKRELPAEIASEVIYNFLFTKKTTRRCPPQWALSLQNAAAAGRPAILILDEINTSTLSVQNVLQKILNERIVGDIFIGEIPVVGLANPTNTSISTYNLSEPIVNRCAHVNADVDVAAFVRYLTEGKSSKPLWLSVVELTFNKIIPSEWDRWARVIAAYLNQFPRALYGEWVDDDDIKKNKKNKSYEELRGYPTARTWEMVCKFLARGTNHKDDFVNLIFSACIGNAEAARFFDWYKKLNLPQVEDVIGGSAEMPKNPYEAYIVAEAMFDAVVNKYSDNRWKRVYSVLRNYPRLDVMFPILRKMILLSQSNKDSSKAMPIPQETKEFLAMVLIDKD